MGEKDKWTAEQDALIRLHYKYNLEHLLTLPELAERTRVAICLRANIIGCQRRPWTPDEDKIINGCYRDYGPMYCMRYLKGRTKIAISSRAKALGVKRDLSKCKNKLPTGNVLELNELMYNKPWNSKK